MSSFFPPSRRYSNANTIKSCAGCRALLLDGTYPIFTCQLGRKTESIEPKYYDQRLGKFPTIRPVDKCSKPRTNKALVDIMLRRSEIQQGLMDSISVNKGK